MESEPLRDRISDLYFRALACTPEARGALLEEACAGDAALRSEVESLLRYESGSARFLEIPAEVVPEDFTGAPDESQMIGRQFGPYTLVAPLGAGGMGEVYRARDSKLPRDVAIKILPSHFSADAERRARFAREARLLATLNHPNIGAIHGLEDTDGVTALILELVEGPTLADRLARGPLPIAEALTIGRQIAEALDAAHEKGIVHRDLKPANVVLQNPSNAAGVPSREARARVLDFGLAKALRVAGQADATHGHTASQPGTVDGRVLGTPSYMSPEQARGQAVDKRTDVWAFGCVLFEMLSGTRTFDGDTMSDTLVRVLEHEPDWGALPAATPKPIRTLLERCLRKDPRKRLHDIADALIEIDDDARLTGATAPAAPVPPPTDSLWTRERLAWIVSAALAVVLVGVVLNHLRTTPPPPPVTEFTIVPADGSSFTGAAPHFAISSDGQHIAFAASSKGVPMVWIRSLDTAALRSLPGTEGATQPFWSPDNRSVGFFADGRQLKTVLVSGGSPAVLCDAVRRGSSGAPGGTWNRDDTIVFHPGGPGPLQKITTGSVRGHAVPVTTLSDGETAHRFPWFLPDGQHFLYMARGAATYELRVGSLASGPTASLGAYESHVVYAADHIFFVRGGNLMARPFDATRRQPTGAALTLAALTGVDSPTGHGMFSVADTGTLAYSQTARTPSELTWFDRGGMPRGVVGEPRVVYNLALSPDERQVAAAQFTQQPGGQSQFDIWLIDLDRAGAGTRLTDDPALEFDPAWSPGGDRVVFNSNRPEPGKSPYNLFVRASDGSGKDELLVKSDHSISAPDWSRDGRFLVYVGGDEDLLTVEINASQPEVPEVFLATPHAESSPAFSPNGKWIAYQSNSSGRPEVYVLPFPKRGAPIPISREGGRLPQWRGDGRELFFVSLDGYMMSAGLAATRNLTALSPTQLFKVDIRPGNARPYVVTKDGQRFLIPIATQGGPITVVSNWRAKLAQ